MIKTPALAAHDAYQTQRAIFEGAVMAALSMAERKTMKPSEALALIRDEWREVEKKHDDFVAKCIRGSR